MKHRERGSTSIELVVAIAIVAVIGGASASTTFQVIRGTECRSDHMTAICQIENAGFWITTDTQMMESVHAEGLEQPNFLVLTWTEQDYTGGDPIHHSVTYYFDELSGGIGKLKRNHWSDAGTNECTLVAQYIYYDPDDPDNTSMATYQNPVLTVRLTALFGDASEYKEYTISRRPKLD